MGSRRPAPLRRSLLFVPGLDRAGLLGAPASGADVLILELEAFVPPGLRPQARLLTTEVLTHWRRAGLLTAVRVNPLEQGGLEDLEAVMGSAPDVVAMSLVEKPEQVVALAEAVGRLEAEHGLEPGSTELMPNVETAVGLVNTLAIVSASERVKSALVASEDMSASLGALRGEDGIELLYVRSRFLVECVAAGEVAIDCPYTFADEAGLLAECRHARRLGYKSKSTVVPGHCALINQVLTPSAAELDFAHRAIAAFEADPGGQPQLDGRLLELPIYLNSKRVVERAEALDRS